MLFALGNSLPSLFHSLIYANSGFSFHLSLKWRSRRFCRHFRFRSESHILDTKILSKWEPPPILISIWAHQPQLKTIVVSSSSGLMVSRWRRTRRPLSATNAPRAWNMKMVTAIDTRSRWAECYKTLTERLRGRSNFKRFHNRLGTQKNSLPDTSKVTLWGKILFLSCVAARLQIW